MNTKKLTALLLLTLATVMAWGFDGFIPATELSGKYLKFSSYYQKTYAEFDSGFNRMGFMIAKPMLYKNFGLEADVQSWGDDALKRSEIYISPGYKINDNLTVAVSGGLRRTSLDKDQLIFPEQDEQLSQYETLAPVVGASLHAQFFDRRLQFGLGFYNINEPDVAFIDKDSEKLPMKMIANLDWQATSWLTLSPYYMYENKDHFYGLNVNLAMPGTGLSTNLYGSSERFTVAPEINTLNYWTFKVGYDYNLESDLTGTNYFIFASHEVVPEVPIEVAYTDKWWEDDYYETEDNQVKLDFTVNGPERLRSVSVMQGNNNLLYKRNLREYDTKQFATFINLKQAQSDSIKIHIEPVSGEAYDHTVEVMQIQNHMEWSEEIPVPELVQNGQKINLSWVSTVINGQYDLFLYENGEKIAKLNSETINTPSSTFKANKGYQFNWDVSNIQDGKEYRYHLQLVEKRTNMDIITPDFHGRWDIIWDVKLDNLAQLEFGSKADVTWKSTVQKPQFELALFKDGNQVENLTPTPITNEANPPSNYVVEKDYRFYKLTLDTAPYKNCNNSKFVVKLVERTKQISRETDPFVIHTEIPAPHFLNVDKLAEPITVGDNVPVTWKCTETGGLYDVFLYKNDKVLTKLNKQPLQEMKFNWNVDDHDTGDANAYNLLVVENNSGLQGKSQIFKLNPRPIKPAVLAPPAPAPAPEKAPSPLGWVILALILIFILFFFLAKRRRKQ